MNPGQVLHTLRTALVTATIGAVTYALAGLSTNALGPFVFTALAGGVITAVVLVGINRRYPASRAVDPFARDAFSTDTLNFAHVRVAGVGGAGLLVVVAILAFQYALTTVALTAGMAGGIVIGLVLIARRRAALRPR